MTFCGGLQIEPGPSGRISLRKVHRNGKTDACKVKVAKDKQRIHLKQPTPKLHARPSVQSNLSVGMGSSSLRPVEVLTGFTCTLCQCCQWA